MKTNEAIKLVEKTFTHEFSEAQFTIFIRNLLPGINKPSTRIITNAQIPKGYRDHVKQYTRIGTYHDESNNVIDVVIVQLKDAESLNRARSRQRNMMAYYLNRRSKDAVLAAYVCDDPGEWRFSFVKLAYNTKVDKEGRVRVEKTFTPAQRFSFLVGENEPNHTAQQQLGNLLTQKEKPTLTNIETAFNIESVTKAFFTDYKELFLEIKDNLDAIVENDLQIKTEFRKYDIETTNFAKKLLGQIVFLYFLQKKGWLGVQDGKAWGSGNQQFLYCLFQTHKNVNFFDEILEPFFYEALAVERPGDYYPALQCKVPFLNGGLFEPLQGYDWQRTHVNLDNKVFEHVFEVFNLYNFTVREDEPLEKEVAVDPEMLGKVFENLLEVKDRKSKGAFYTPREIVHYMCQESLINYLYTTLNNGPITYEKVGDKQLNLVGNKGKTGQLEIQIPHEQSKVITKRDIEQFIREGETSAARDEARENGELKDDDFGLPESIRTHAEAVDRALAEVKICDPAIGSAAFPVGMMNEIVRARIILTPFLAEKTMRDTYSFKWHCIEKNLYGVDIDPSAIEIAKLRLWLSLVVDEESYDNIRPLPNLDYRIVCGNSLLSVEKNLFNYSLYSQLEQRKNQYFITTSTRNKKILRSEIENLIDQLTNGKELFDFEVYFNEIFSKKDGFDIVIGNPPYIDSEEMVKSQQEEREAYNQNYEVAKGNWDIYIVFFSLGIRLLSQIGTLIFITPDKWISKSFGDALRIKYIKNLNSVLLAGREVFQTANVDAIVTSFTKSNHSAIKIYSYIEKEIKYIRDFPKSLLVPPFRLDLIFSDYIDLIGKIEKDTFQFQTYYQCENACATSDAYKLKRILTYLNNKEFDPNTELKVINTGTIGKYISKWGRKEMIYLKDKYLFPIVKKDTFIDNFPNSYSQKSIAPKIIIKGLTLLDACLDENGSIVPGKSTLLIPNNDINELFFLLALINSELIFFYIKEKYSASSYNTGINFSKDMINKLPLKIIDFDTKQHLIQLVKELISFRRVNFDSDFSKFQNELDSLIYKIYGISAIEIKHIKETI